ncbi:MAG: glycosyltransferase [Prevotellaceae bacterium]|jgi:glycosyltransferase involved in cell wall biosynthesis|nr:glycosyltransferase [Prevotellaceae bacterium]
MNDKVSVITPCYNSDSFIAEAIDSVINQTYSNWEMLIVDDCSNDNSAAVIASYREQDDRIKYFKTDAPSGSPSLPRNIATENASGQYIAFLDSDDTWFPTKLEKQVKLLKNNDTAIAFSSYEKISEDGRRSNRIVKAPAATSYKKLLRGNVICLSSAAYDSEKVGKQYFQKIGHEDYVFWLAILKKGFIARNTKSVETLYRICESSISSNKLKTMAWQWNIYKNIEKIGFFGRLYNFTCYAFKALLKSLK